MLKLHAVALGVVVLATGCSPAARTHPDPVASIGPLSNGELARYRSGTVAVYSADDLAELKRTGIVDLAAGIVFLSDSTDGTALIVTAKHAVTGKYLTVESPRQHYLPAAVLYRSKTADLALLEVPVKGGLAKEGLSQVRLAKAEDPKDFGSSLAVLGHPFGRRWSASYAFVPNDVAQKSSGEETLVCVGCGHGDSGGPVFDRSSGMVVGVVIRASASDPQTGATTVVAERAATVRRFLAEYANSP
jgi:hypothetical protein